MIEIMIPATSANIGPGFDCLGIALNIYNKFYIEEIEEGLIIEGCEEKYAGEENLVYTSMQKCFEKTGYKPKGIKITMDTQVPVSRGLGSSSTCILGGIIGANELSGGILKDHEILELATEIEGHPDNVAPALFGGLVVSIYEDNQVFYSKMKLASGIKFYALIPDFKLSTKVSRSVLPTVVPHGDAVFNVGRVALMMGALVNGEFDLLKVASKDKLHQQYRGSLIDGYDIILDGCEKLGCKGVFLSGSGPTILVAVDEKDVSQKREIQKLLDSTGNKWDIKELNIDDRGYVVNKL
ncbi:homoserine kinase ThrB [Gottschalkia purinilytica]|uniref:Homoserine kinase n=1 Tax=Gottschalkia purinilytica TaxID=1503 RepID=A0A0L0W7Y1_GOTPU|nr:homoserine kinase [Gottschalkia purinilytica]KNF07546.1 homoserine kinase ThrB [Gottschalkia purinilytica]